MILKIAKGIWRKKSLLRTLKNLELANYSVRGKVLDIGGGVNPSYFEFLKKEEGAEIINIDFKSLHEIGKTIDLEKDPLPYSDGSIDHVLVFNLFEHIYNYRFLAGEIKRVLKPGRQVLGFVPFMMSYHPDPRDYFRYTKEALRNIFGETGFKNIQIIEVGLGPCAVSYNIYASFPFPRFIKLIALPFYYYFDLALIKLRPKLKEKYPLGYVFILEK